MPKRYSLQQKIRALNALRQQDYAAVSEAENVPVTTLQSWQRQSEALQSEYRDLLKTESSAKMAEAQQQIADKALLLLDAIDEERIRNAPLNQVSSALGTLVDRFLKLQETESDYPAHTEKVIRIEYYDASTGTVSQTPPWASSDSEASGTLQSGGVREALRQNGDGEDRPDGTRFAWDENLVARPDLSDGESSLARFEIHDDERPWYHD